MTTLAGSIVEENKRAAEEIEWQDSDNWALWEYNTYWAGVDADEYCQQYVDYTRGCEEELMRKDAEYEYDDDGLYANEMAEYWEEQEYYNQQEYEFDKWIETLNPVQVYLLELCDKLCRRRRRNSLVRKVFPRRLSNFCRESLYRMFGAPWYN